MTLVHITRTFNVAVDFMPSTPKDSQTKTRFHVAVSTRISIRNTQILHCTLR